MTEQTNKRQLFFGEAVVFIEYIRHSLRVRIASPATLTNSIPAVISLKQAATAVGAGSLRSIADRLERVLNRHSIAQTVPDRIELETVELAVDWLAQLAILYGENLPEPKSLVAELLYAFDLVERAQGAAMPLAELTDRDDVSHVDPFVGDPGFDVAERSVAAYQDPFLDDPGFGLEFDLLQRTISFVTATENINIDNDLFGDDSALDAIGGNDSKRIPETVELSPSDDLFAADPPLSGGLDS